MCVCVCVSAWQNGGGGWFGAALQQDLTASEPNTSKALTTVNKTKSNSKVCRQAGKIHRGAFTVVYGTAKPRQEPRTATNIGAQH